ncbi:unnamed protein product [Bursaphelenchus okinawaensis]|uniref:Uncharacterized protein n=1 Tax=Bursaphelenchus okinawaensis TaxID=465554 RepID=A0A811LCF0_9BILA|nr:unnamed protein product [Bursaphelenchus okinawaensis]CAG9120543.1 unnamed protein product [Bursaphelenchus okinawaensis]
MEDGDFKFWYDMLKTTMIVRQLRLESWSEHFNRLVDETQLQELERVTTTRIVVEEDCIQIFGTPRGTRTARDLLRSFILASILDNEPNVKNVREARNVRNVNISLLKSWKNKLVQFRKLLQIHKTDKINI